MKGCIAIIVLCASVIVQSENVCPEDYTQELLLRHEDCDKFYKCAFGEPVEQDCPAGLHFNLDLEQCDWKENVDCTDRNDPTNPKPEESVPESEEEPEPESEKEPTPDPEEEPTPESEEEPESESEEEPTPDPEEEPTPESEEELESESEEEPTPDPEEEPLPEPEEEPLPEPEEEPAPEPEEEPVVEPEEGSAEEESSEPEIDVEEDGSGQEIDELVSKEIDDIEVLENGCPVDPHVHWLLPHEDYCNLFYYCVWGEKVLRECPASLHFNSVLQVCDWPNDAGCLSSFNKHVEARRALLEDF